MRLGTVAAVIIFLPPVGTAIVRRLFRLWLRLQKVPNGDIGEVKIPAL
jgi:hypothetical protein